MAYTLIVQLITYGERRLQQVITLQFTSQADAHRAAIGLREEFQDHSIARSVVVHPNGEVETLHS